LNIKALIDTSKSVDDREPNEMIIS